MPGLFPNPSAAPEIFNIGDAVRWYTSEKSISPYVGRVVAVEPGIVKVWVEWPVGGKRQHSPEELILVPPQDGKPTVNEESGYTNYGIQESYEDFGKLESEKARKLANNIVSNVKKDTGRNGKIQKMASKIAGKFAENVVEKLSTDIAQCKDKGYNEVFTYQSIYKKYANTCSDHLIRYAIEKIYNELNQE